MSLTHAPWSTLALIVSLAGAMLALSACETVKGVGRDLRSVGNAVEDAARNAED